MLILKIALIYSPQCRSTGKFAGSVIHQYSSPVNNVDIRHQSLLKAQKILARMGWCEHSRNKSFLNYGPHMADMPKYNHEAYSNNDIYMMWLYFK
jgi:hypothetical protein